MPRNHNLLSGVASAIGPFSRGRLWAAHGAYGGGDSGPTLIEGSLGTGGLEFGTAGTATAISSYVAPAGDDKILIVKVAGRRGVNQDPYPVTAVTFGGSAMTEVTGARTGDRGTGGPSIIQWFIYYLGSTTPTGNIAITTNAYYHFEVDAIVIQGAAQSGQPAASGSTGTYPTATAGSSTALTGLSGNHFIVSGVIAAEGADNLAPDETVINERTRAANGSTWPTFRTGLQYAEASGDKTMSWTYTGAASRYHGAIAFAGA